MMKDDNNVYTIGRPMCDLIDNNILAATNARRYIMDYTIHTTTKWVMMDDSYISTLALANSWCIMNSIHT